VRLCQWTEYAKQGISFDDKTLPCLMADYRSPTSSTVAGLRSLGNRRLLLHVCSKLRTCLVDYILLLQVDSATRHETHHAFFNALIMDVCRSRRRHYKILR
jgi:hypothetical protein